MPALRACPFCRALYARGEAKLCPDCGLKLVPMQSLPPSLELLQHEVEAGEQVAPEHRPLPRFYLGLGRGLVLLSALVGLGCFFLPWVTIESPDGITRSGFELARGRAGFLWGGAAGYLVLLPLIASRRSQAGLLGVRLIAALLASVTLFEVALLLLLPPHGHPQLPVRVRWEPGLYLSGIASLAAAGCALFLGRGRRTTPLDGGRPAQNAAPRSKSNDH